MSFAIFGIAATKTPAVGQGLVWDGMKYEPGTTSGAASALTGLTLNRVPFGTSSGGLQDSGNLTFNGTALALTGTMSISGQFTSTLATGSAPFVVASTTVVGNLNVSLLLGSTWAAPGTIGSGTPSTGAFTTLSASSTFHANGGTIDWPTVLTMSAQTSDGADNGRVLIGGGGAISSSRGAYLQVIGNEFGSAVSGCGFFQIGDATSAYFAVNGNGGTSFQVTNTNTIAFYGVTAVAQYATTGTSTGFTAGAGTTATSLSTFTGNTGATAYTVGDIVRALKLIGIMTA